MNIKKIITTLSTVAVLGSATVVPATQVYASENLNYNYEEPHTDLNSTEEQLISELAHQLEIVFEHAAITDSSGNIIDIDYEMISEEYQSKELELFKHHFEQTINSSHQKSTRSVAGDFFDCMTKGLTGTLAGNKIQALYSVKGALMGLLKAKSWKAAATMIITTTGTSVTAPVIVGILSGAAVGCGLSALTD